MKHIGTNKLNFAYPAQIIIIQDNIVNYNETHLGDECEAAHLYLNSDTCSLIADN